MHTIPVTSIDSLRNTVGLVRSQAAILRVIAFAGLLQLNANTPVRGADSGAEAEVRAVLQEYDAAWLRQDVAAFERLLAPEFEIVEWDGQVRPRAAVIADARDGSLKFEIGESRDVRIVVREGTAVVRGIWRGKGAYKDKPFNDLVRYTATFTKVGDQWKALGDHLVKVSAAAAIEQLHQLYAQGGDAAAAARTAARWTKDAWGMSPHHPVTKGRPALEAETRQYFQTMRDERFRFEAVALEYEQVGDWAYNIAQFKETKADGTLVDEGMMMGIWKIEDGEWKLHRDIWNSSVPKKNP